MKTFKAKTRKWGNSIGIVIDSLYADEENIDEGDIVEVIAVKLTNEKKVKHYKCKICSYNFHSDEDYPYCPACDESGIKNLEVIE